MLFAYDILSVEKLTIIEIKFSLSKIERITFQSVVHSPNKRHIDSHANLTGCGGLVKERISTKFCFLMDCTAIKGKQKRNRNNLKTRIIISTHNYYNKTSTIKCLFSLNIYNLYESLTLLSFDNCRLNLS